MVVTAAVIAIVVALVVVVVSYAAGRSAGKRETVPWRPIFQLVDHYRKCLGEDPAAVRGRLTAALDVPPWAWDELLRRRPALPPARRPVHPEGPP